VHRPPTLARLEEAARLAAMITGNFEEHARSLSDEIRVAVLNLVAINSAVHLHSVIW
jgi:hypothetical protein